MVSMPDFSTIGKGHLVSWCVDGSVIRKLGLWGQKADQDVQEHDGWMYMWVIKCRIIYQFFSFFLTSKTVCCAGRSAIDKIGQLLHFDGVGPLETNSKYIVLCSTTKNRVICDIHLYWFFLVILCNNQFLVHCITTYRKRLCLRLSERKLDDREDISAAIKDGFYVCYHVWMGFFKELP